jgi:hypothetical protein
MQKVLFSCDATVKTSHEGIGSGLDFDVLGKKYEAIRTHGTLTLRCGWTTDKDGAVLCPKGLKARKDSRDPLDQPEERKLSDSFQLDPNDPRNIEKKMVINIDNVKNWFSN